MTRQTVKATRLNLECPLCGTKGKGLFYWTPPYRLNFCPGCEVLFGDPMPSEIELSEYYQGFLYRKPRITELMNLIEAKRKEIQNLFGSGIQVGRRFLDFGGGTGIASMAALKLGLVPTVFEIDNDSIEFINSIDPDDSIEKCSNITDLEDRFFDLILVDNVIEHVREPKTLMKFLYDHLEHGGHLVIKTPNARNTESLFHPLVSVNGYLRTVYRFNGLASGISAAFFRPWTLDPPRHLYSFSAKSLSVMAEQTGVDNAEIGFYRIPLWEYAISKKLFRFPNSGRRLMISLILIPISLLEVVTKLIEVILREANLISPGGVYIRIDRD